MIFPIDSSLNAIMVSIENSALTMLSKWVAIAFDPTTLIIISFLIAAFLFFRGTKKESIFFASTMAIAGILILATKEIFQIIRPLNPLILENSYSFPSGHATIGIVFFGLIAYALSRRKSPKIKIFIFVLASLIVLLIGFTRIYLRVHWLSDVLGGFILGAIILIISLRILQRI